jgi:hypothetical protein
VHQDLAEFTNLAHMDVAGNNLKFEDLSTIPRLEVLEIALNGIRTLNSMGGFLSLTILDLSYNNLEPEAILSLGNLPALRSLDLSNNGLARVPHSMAAANDESGESSFAALETLTLDDNKLTAPGIFQALAGLPRLSVLDLNRNRISFVPQLVPSIPDGMETEVDPNAVKPFASLQMLSMTENRIEHAEDVLTVATWDNVEALHLAGNPIITKKSALPAELTEELRRRQNRGQPGIHVPRSTNKPTKPSLTESLPLHEVVKVEPLILPQIARGNSLREYEAEKAKQQFLEYTTSRPASTAGPLKVVPPITPQPAPVPEDDEDDDGAGFFMTQLGEGAVAAPMYTDEGELVPYDLPVLAADETFDVSRDEMAEAQRLGIVTPMSRMSSAHTIQSLGDTAPGPDDTAYIGDEDFTGDALQAEVEAAEEMDHAIVPFVANLPMGVEKKFSELFREDTEEEQALGPVKYVPVSIKATTQALRFALQKPLTLVFDRKPVGGAKKPQLALTAGAAGDTREWHLQNLEQALAEF